MIWLGEAMGCACGKEEIHVNDRKFRILKKIGEGGFSYVYLGEEIGGVGGKKGPWAIKKMECHSQRETERAKREINIHQTLGDHPNILGIETYEIGGVSTHQPVVYQGRGEKMTPSSVLVLVLPFYKRGTLEGELRARLETKESISEKRVLRIFLSVCLAIQEFHKNGFVHRDIKPGNVLLSDADEGVLMDFGSVFEGERIPMDSKEARGFEDEASEHSSMPYRAPELFHVDIGRTIGYKTDIWSLGCLLYALCFFQSPFDPVYQRGDSVALAVAAGNVKIPPDSKFSDELHELIEEMLQLSPEQRPNIGQVIQKVQALTSQKDPTTVVA